MSAVSRSIYQKVCEENKRLKADIKILVESHGDAPAYIETILKWRKVFREQKQFNVFMKEAAIRYLEQHPEIKIPTL